MSDEPAIPLNSFFRKSLKSLRPRGSESSSLKLKVHRSTRIFVGVSTLSQRQRGVNGGVEPLWRGVEPLWRGGAGSLGHVEGPVCDVIGQPGVAGEAAGQEGVVAAVGGAVLHDPGEQKRRASARPERHIYLKRASARAIVCTEGRK